jgi:hypothetical protein
MKVERDARAFMKIQKYRGDSTLLTLIIENLEVYKMLSQILNNYCTLSNEYGYGTKSN